MAIISYANNNPYKYVDPDGELAFLIIPLAILAIETTAVILAGVLTYALSSLSFNHVTARE